MSLCQVWYETSCYYFVPERVAWPTALQNCNDSGAQLLAIEDAEENTFLTNHIRATPELYTTPPNGSTKKIKGKKFDRSTYYK